MSELGICDLEQDIQHEKLFSCENWRSIEPKIEKARHAVGVSVLLIEAGCLLLGERGQKTTNVEARGMLSTPGGRLELEETFLDCAKREFKEETGAELAGDLKILGIRKFYRFGEHYIMVYVLATDHTGVIANPEGDDKCKDGWHWFKPNWVLYDPRTTVTEPKNILHLAWLKQFIGRRCETVRSDNDNRNPSGVVMILSYYAECQNCFAENRLPLTNQDIPRAQVKESIFECGECHARLGENYEATKEVRSRCNEASAGEGN